MKFKESIIKYRYLILIFFIVLPFYATGFRQDLPYSPKVDEFSFVKPAIRISSTGDFHPHRLGQPGSTTVYPLTFIYSFENLLFHNGLLLHSDPNIQVRFDANPEIFYLLGRMLNVLYALISIPVIFLLSSRFFNKKVSFFVVLLSLLTPSVIDHAQTVRTDIPALLFSILSIWLIIKTTEKPTITNQLLTGASIGLSIASRYFMIILIPLLLLTYLRKICLKHTNAILPKNLIIIFCVGILAIFITFTITTPYFFLDFPTVIEHIKHEARPHQLGADNLSYIGNFLWYLSVAIPNSISWPLALLAYFGLIKSIFSKNFSMTVLVLFTSVFLLIISLSSLHWDYWIVPLIPLILIFSMIGFLNVINKRNIMIKILLIVLFIAPFGYQFLIYDFGKIGESTRIQARHWIVTNLPAKSKIAQEEYTAPLTGTDFVQSLSFSLAEENSAGHLKLSDYDYIMTSSYIFNRYFQEPKYYPKEIYFYKNLGKNAHFMIQFKPSLLHSGPVINIYKIR